MPCRLQERLGKNAYLVLVLDQKNNGHDVPLCADKCDAEFPTIVAHGTWNGDFVRSRQACLIQRGMSALGQKQTFAPQNVMSDKCGGMQRAPFRWYETVPMLLHKGSVESLIAIARQADASLQEEFGLPLGLIIIDTIAACAGYVRAGDENDPAAGQAVMNVLKAVAQAIGCFVLGIDHFGKNLEAGTRGATARRPPAILYWRAWATRK